MPASIRAAIPGVDAARRAEADGRLLDLVQSRDLQMRMESLVLSGDPSEEIVRLVQTRGAGLIVMGLHSSGLFGPRMGSVTYRVLCQTQALVLALPAAASAAGKWIGLADITAAS